MRGVSPKELMGDILPRVSYCNYKLQFPNAHSACWSELLKVKCFSANRLWHFQVRHHCIAVDFRFLRCFRKSQNKTSQ